MTIHRLKSPIDQDVFMRSHASGNLPTSTYTVPNIREKLQLQTCKGHFRVSSLITLLK